MKRKNFYWLLLDSLFLIVFNLLFFTLGDCRDYTNSVWLSYGFIHFAYIALLFTPFLVRRSNLATPDYARPLYAITTSYFIIELVVGVIIILIAPETVTAALIIQVILAALFLAYLLTHLLANEHTADSVERHEAEVHYIKEAGSMLAAFLTRITDKAATKKVESLYDLIRSSPTKSHPSIHSIEQRIIRDIRELCSRNENETAQILSSADGISRLVEERNRQLKSIN